jgi:glutathione S-transferase
MEDRLILYAGDRNRSSWSMRAFLMLRTKGLEFEERTIELDEDPDRSHRREVSPTGKVPVLHHGDLVIPDSLAILEYLEERFPPPRFPALWPADPRERAHARWLAAAMHSGFARLREVMSFHLCFRPDKPAVPDDAAAEAREALGFWEAALAAKRAPGAFLFGPFGGADAMFAPVVIRLTSFRVSRSGTPKAAAYMEAVLAHPAVEEWMTEARRLPAPPR